MSVMNRTIQGCRQIGAALILLVCAVNVLAQDASMTLYVFKKGMPQPDIEVLLDDQLQGVTNENGVILLDIPAGIRYLEIRDQDLVVLSQQLLVNQDEVSQWIVNLTDGLTSLVDVESSAGGAESPIPGDSVPTYASGEPGTLSGTLISADDGRPIEGARVFISGQGSDIRTGADGKFSLDLPAGVYSVSVLHAAHNTFTQDDIEVLADDTVSVSFELTPSGSELPEFVVIEPYIEGSLASVLEERRTDLAVANILGAEAISRAGDSTAAGALRRVTGLTLVDGRFIYVRGLGERYSSTLLNNANVPSPDPTRRVVPLDLFPTSIVQSIAVQKGYTSDLPAEFGGGAVELRTKSIPETPFLEFAFGLDYRDGTSFSEGLRYKGGSKDWTGKDDGTRAEPEPLATATANGTPLEPFNRFTGEGFSPAQLQRIGQSLAANYNVFETEIDPNLDAGVAGGYVWNLDNGDRFGFLAATEYKDDWLTTNQQRTQYVVGSENMLVPQADTTFDSTIRNINLSFFVTAGYEFAENHSLSYNWMLLRNTFDRAQVELGSNPDVEGGDVLFRELEWIERELVANQFMGEHILPDADGLTLRWQYTDATATADAPDTRRYRYDPDRRTPNPDDFIFSLRNDSNQRRWAVLDDFSTSWNVDIDMPLDFGFKRLDVMLRTGLNGVKKNRESSIRRFAFFSEGPVGSDLATLRLPSLDDIINNSTIAPDGWQLEEVTNATDAYTGAQTIDAWYFGLDLDMSELWRFSTGVRYEQSALDVSTFTFADPDNAIITEQVTDDPFPYVVFTWLQGNNQVRAGYSETINRPDFKELSPSEFRDPLLDRIVRGNPELLPAFLTNYDLRWDYYFDASDFVSLGVFLKEFENPIETVILASAGAQLTTFANAQTAENYGVEFELYKTLGMLDDWWGWGDYWNNVYINTNYTWIESEITLADDDSTIQTSDNRPLQGQSPYVFNFQVGYDDPERDINAALLYNVFGARIVEVGVQGAPDIYEQPVPSLDLIYSQGFGNWTFKASLKNILNPTIELTQGTELTRVVQPIGWKLGVGVEYTFQ